MTNFQSTTYSISEAADKLNLSEKTLRRWEEAGRFTPSRTVGNQRRYSMQDLQILDAIKNNIIPHQNSLLSRTAAAQFLGVTEQAIDDLVAEGRLHPFTTVESTFYPRQRLLPLLATPTPEPALHFESDSPRATTPGLKQPGSPPPIHTATSPRLSQRSSWSISNYLPLLNQVLVTIIIVIAYHFIFGQSKVAPNKSTQSGAVQGVSTSPTLTLLEDMLDVSTGGITATTVTTRLGTTTPNLTLLPGVAPSTPLPGSLYYDAGSNTLKIYTDTGWHNLTTTTQLEQGLYNLESKLATPSGNQSVL